MGFKRKLSGCQIALLSRIPGPVVIEYDIR